MSSSRADSHTESTESKNSEKTSLLAIDMSTSPLIGSLSDNVEDRRQLEDCSDTANDPLTQGSSVDRSTLETRLTTTPAGHAPAETGEFIDPADIMYAANSFMAIIKPVTLTMVLSATITVSLYHNTAGATNRALSVYEVYHESANTLDTSSVRLGKSLVNALMIVLVLAAATFFIVMMYWLRCMRCLWGYMALSSTILLGLLGGAVWLSILQAFQLPCDVFTYYGMLWNFAIVGVVAIFYQKGIPTVVTQGYLVATSVIMSWQLSRFEEWTGWCLLVVLALYDLCAVLTPCGPLKALVGLMQKYDDPMPGLLYEAELPAGTARPQPRVATREQSPNAAGSSPREPRNRRPLEVERGEAGESTQGQPEPRRVLASPRERSSMGAEGDSNRRDAAIGSDGGALSVEDHGGDVEPGVGTDGAGSGTDVGTGGTESRMRGARHRTLVLSSHRGTRGDLEEEMTLMGGDRDMDRSDSANLTRDEQTREAASEQDVRVDHSTAQDVMEEGVSIKLGLGDFVFYSVLVSKAALYGFTAWAACIVVIVFGLGATLVLLALYRMALPALPISIGLGTMFYLITRFAIQPYVETLNDTPLYM